ncbi:MAG TPA: hypothetical protein VN756_08830 [Solirubrobacterales bacterium]|nr:hypothetical protein [Solirubrobacterales bacterium]
MADFKMVDISLSEATALTEISYPNPTPHPDVTLLIVAYNEEERIGHLLDTLKPYFDHTVVCVQESTDKTLEIVRGRMTRPGDTILTDAHWGHGDKSFPRMVGASMTRWCFVVSCDEMPNAELLDSISTAIAVAESDLLHNEAIWVPFRSWIDDIEIEADHGHLRLFRRSVGWPETLHSRPMTQKAIWWPHGCIEHRRSLDEMMIDYLNYFERGRGHIGWETHNRAQMNDACAFVAGVKGWAYVMSFPWWERVQEITGLAPLAVAGGMEHASRP